MSSSEAARAPGECLESIGQGHVRKTQATFRNASSQPGVRRRAVQTCPGAPECNLDLATNLEPA